ncbi:MAG: DUF3793 family protein [Clostridiales bacterium]|uniref:DUF3793 family protein n=1 Tax=Terrisporobacter sp. TaxID=1965305 RepID=UPI002A50FB27|nr:DUF3793 family protein [Terrisporobacter sp.]MDD7753415.1 DUF3793 family protein [Clostridiales bacterium]MDY4135072.1 DUF3793 family protein [Terrisporobacter sp.]
MKLECNKKCCENKSNSLYIKRILEMLGAVILGSKPAEIINVPGSKEDKKIKLSQIEAFFSNCSRITYRIITTHDGGKRVLFINEKSMEKVLVNKRCINFLKFVGYPADYQLNDYMDELVFRLQSEEFPHEIGVFLGYPLKDVLGFMGYGKNELVEVKNWRIYGDKEISYEVYNNFMRDKAIMKEMIETMNINELRRVI